WVLQGEHAVFGFSADGRLLAIDTLLEKDAARRALAAIVSVRDAASGTELACSPDHGRHRVGRALTSDGKLLVVAEDEAPAVQVFRVLETFTGREVGAVRVPRTPRTFVSSLLSPDDRTLLVAYQDGEQALLKLWDLARREETATLKAPGLTCAFSHEGTLLAAGRSLGPKLTDRRDAPIQVWDVRTGDACATFPCGAHGVGYLAFS